MPKIFYFDPKNTCELSTSSDIKKPRMRKMPSFFCSFDIKGNESGKVWTRKVSAFFVILI